LVAIKIYSSNFQKSLIGYTTPEEDHDATANYGYLYLNQAERAPG
jgi:hypothetical protein